MNVEGRRRRRARRKLSLFFQSFSENLFFSFYVYLVACSTLLDF